MKDVTIQDICNLNSLKGIKIITGEGNINKVVAHINVMEVPDIENWVQDNEFLMTTGYMFKNDPLLFINVIKNLKLRNVSALGIKPNRYIEEIPQEIIAYAKQIDFVILELPEQTSFSKVIKEGMEQIIISEKKHRSKFFKQLLLGNISNEEMLYDAAKDIEFDLNMNKHYRMMCMIDNNFVMYEKESIYQQIKLLARKNEITSHHIILENRFMIILQYENEKKLSVFYKELEELLRNNHVQFYTSNTNLGIFDLSTQYTNIKKIDCILNLKLTSKNLIQYKDLGIHSLIAEISGNQFLEYYSSIYLDPLLEYEKKDDKCLLDTLKTYISCNCNVKETANCLYSHYNTILYRLNIIKDIVPVDFKNMEQVCILYLVIMNHYENLK